MKTKQQLQRRILAHCRFVALKCSFKLPSERKDFSLPFKCFVSSLAQSLRLNRKLKAPLQGEFKDFYNWFRLSVLRSKYKTIVMDLGFFFYNFVRKKVYFWCKVRSFYSPKLVLIVVTFSLSLHYFSKFFSSLIFHAEVVLLSWEKNSIPRVHKRFNPSVLVFFNRSTIWATTSHAARGSLVGPFPDCTRILDAAGWAATCYSVDPGGALLISVGFSRKVAFENSDQFVHSCSLL